MEEARKIYQDYLSIGKPFGLFLRAFESEAYRYGVPVSELNPEERDIYRLGGEQSVERHLYSAVHQRIPFIAIISPVDLLAGGLIPRFSGGKEWESWAKRLATEAAIIVFHCYALSPGVNVELDLLRRCKREDSTVIVLKEIGASNNPAAKSFISNIAKVTHYEVPQKNHPALAGFPRFVYESDIDWSQPERSPSFGDLLKATLRQASGDLAALPDITWLPPDFRLVVLQERARALRLKGYLERAGTAAAEALAIAQQLGDQENIAAVHVSVGIVAFEMGRLDVALRAFRVSRAMSNKLGNKDGEATAAEWAGRVFVKAGKPEDAVSIFLVALQRSMELKAYDEMADTLQQMAPLLDKIGPDLRRHPGVQLAADLIEQYDLNKGGKRD